MEFVMNNLPFIAIAIVGLFIFFYLLKIAVKAALIVGVVALVLIFVFDVSPTKLIDLGKSAQEATSEKAEEMFVSTIEPVLKKEIESAEFVTGEDGTFIISTESIKIEGKSNDEKVKVNFKGQEFNISLNLLNKFLQENNELIPIN